MNGTGLVEREVRKLAEAQKRELAAWTRGKCGGDVERGLAFLPNAIRWLPLEQRLALAGDLALDAAWEERERRKIADGGEIAMPWRFRRGKAIPGESTGWVPGHAYFTVAYGHLRPPTGPVIPFDPWPEQLEILVEIREHLRQVWLKARQLGMTWLALHDAFHILAFAPETPTARILALSKHGGDASKLIGRAREVRAHLPPFLRPAEASDTRRSLTRFGIVGRGEMLSLAGTPDAARSETAALVLLDEFAFVKNRQAARTLTSVLSTIGEDGRVVALSTGNGPPEVPGDGQAFARLFTRARAGGSRFKAVFLPASTDPRRTAAWRAAEIDSYETPEEFQAEHPETEEQALQGLPGSKVFPPAGINAAERIGRALDDLLAAGELAPPAAPSRAILTAIDWGEQTVGLVLWPLERGGFYVADEFVHAHREPSELVEPLLGRAAALGKVGPAHYDAAGVQSMRTFIATARRARWPTLRSISVPFGEYKREAIVYARRLFRRSWRLADAAERAGLDLAAVVADGWPEGAEDPGPPEPLEAIAQIPESQLVAISARCPTLLRQLRGLEFVDDDSDKVDKGDDHGADAYLAGLAPTARRFRAARGPADERDPDADLDPAVAA